MARAVELLSRIDRGWARLEGWLAIGVLFALVLAAALGAVARNLARFELAWAAQLLAQLSWTEALLRGGTFALAFLGGSLATHRERQLRVDLLVRSAPPRARYTLRACAGFAGGLISTALVVAFYGAASFGASDRPVWYELVVPEGVVHVCDATAQQLASVPGLERPLLACGLRAALHALSLPGETPEAALHLLAPLLLAVIALRLFAYGARDALTVLGGDAAIAQRDERERPAAARPEDEP